MVSFWGVLRSRFTYASRFDRLCPKSVGIGNLPVEILWPLKAYPRVFKPQNSCFMIIWILLYVLKCILSIAGLFHVLNVDLACALPCFALCWCWLFVRPLLSGVWACVFRKILNVDNLWVAGLCLCAYVPIPPCATPYHALIGTKQHPHTPINGGRGRDGKLPLFFST